MKTLKINVDASCYVDTRKATWAVIVYHQKPIKYSGKIICSKSTIAEKVALYSAMQIAPSDRPVEIRTDCMAGVSAFYRKEPKDLFDMDIHKLREQKQNITVRWVPRSVVRDADHIAQREHGR